MEAWGSLLGRGWEEVIAQALPWWQNWFERFPALPDYVFSFPRSKVKEVCVVCDGSHPWGNAEIPVQPHSCFCCSITVGTWGPLRKSAWQPAAWERRILFPNTQRAKSSSSAQSGAAIQVCFPSLKRWPNQEK